jgi:hypothetical protein
MLVDFVQDFKDTKDSTAMRCRRSLGLDNREDIFRLVSPVVAS